jgi:hypothetical protein
MDQVLLVLRWLKKYHFWILVVVVLLVGAGLWAMAKGELAAQLTKRKGELESTRKSVLAVTTEPNPANQAVIDEIKKAHDGLKGNVFQAWNFLWKEQQAKNPWPPELGAEFLEMIKSKGENEEIPFNDRTTYWYFIKDHLPSLDEIVDRRRPREERLTDPGIRPAAGNARTREVNTERLPAGTANAELVGKVFWDDVESVRKGFELADCPSDKRIRLLQEDLWVYRALLTIIKNTNEGATSYNNAAVKAIERMEIGQAASGVFQEVSGRRLTGGAGAAPGAGPGADPSGDESPGGGGGRLGGGFGGGGFGGGGGKGAFGGGGGALGGGGGAFGGARGAGAVAQDVPAEDRESTQMLERRYVDQNGQPIAAGAAQPFAEFKMMPVHMSLIIHQKKIPKLLVECGNSSMPVEVQRIAIIPFGQDPQAVGGAHPAPPRGGGDVEARMGARMGMGAGMGGGDRGASVGAGDRQYGDNYARVDLLGIIYIFNPPDRDKLGTGTAGEEMTATAEGSAAPAGTPAAGTPAAGTPAAGTPAAGTPAAGAPAAGAPAADAPAADAPAAAPAGAPAPPAAAPAAPGPAAPAPAAPANAP